MLPFFRKLNLYPAIIQSLRLLLSIALASLVAYVCRLHEPYWALITAVIVTQSRITQTLQTSRDQIVGSVIGGTAGLMAIALQIYCGWSSIIVFSIMIVPMVGLVSWRPSMRLGVVTLAVVFLFPSPDGVFERPFDRIFSILVGVLAALLVSYCIVRPQGRYHAFLHAYETFDRLYKLLYAILISNVSWDIVEAMNDDIIAELREVASDIDEARKEKPTYILEEADPMLAQLFPILRRLQSDVIFIARAMDVKGHKLSSKAAFLLEPSLKEVFHVFKKQCLKQATQGRSRLFRPDLPDFNRILKPVMEETEKSCSSMMQFTLQALCHDLQRGHEIFSL